MISVAPAFSPELIFKRLSDNQIELSIEIFLSIIRPRALYLLDLVRGPADKRRFLQGGAPGAAPWLNWAEIYDGLCPEQRRVGGTYN